MYHTNVIYVMLCENDKENQQSTEHRYGMRIFFLYLILRISRRKKWDVKNIGMLGNVAKFQATSI
jgi:hypothetical protein